MYIESTYEHWMFMLKIGTEMLKYPEISIILDGKNYAIYVSDITANIGHFLITL